MGAARRSAAVLAAVIGLLLFGAGPAQAHPTLLATSPEAGYAVTEPPEEVVLVFDEPVTPHFVRVLADGRDPVPTAPVEVEQGGRVLAVGLGADLASGRYVVRWRVTAGDGDVVDSAFDFAVGSGTAGLSGRAGEQTVALPLVVVLRWLLFAALAVAVGGLAGQMLVRLTGPHGLPGPRSLVRVAAVVGALAATGLLAHLAATGGGSGRAAPLLGLEAAGFAAAAALAARRRAAVIGLGVVVAAEAWRNHLGVQDGVVGATIVGVHLAAVAVWVGALVHVLRTAHRWGWRGRAVRRLATAYARAALAVFLVVAATGTAGAVLLLPSPGALVDTGYGRALLAKLALVLLVTVLALLARRHLRRTADAPFGRAARGEAVTMTGVLAVTALVVSLPTPVPATEDLGVPLPAAGPVVRLGTLAGQVAVGLAASENQLELRLRVPDEFVQLGEAPPPPYGVSARVSSPGAAPATVALRGCGPGCFVGPVRWRAGVNHVDLRVDAEGWHGGAALLSVPWPPQVDGQILDQVVAVMRAERSFTVVETVTSDTSRADPPAQTVRIGGPAFLDSEPYGDATGLEAVELPGAAGRTVIAFGLPAEGVHVLLELDTNARIVRETLAAPKHLSERTFRYDPDG